MHIPGLCFLSVLAFRFCLVVLVRPPYRLHTPTRLHPPSSSRISYGSGQPGVVPWRGAAVLAELAAQAEGWTQTAPV